MLKKIIVFLFVFLFSTSQVYSYFHNVEHDFQSHKHGSVPCLIYLTHTKSKEFLNDFNFLEITLNSTLTSVFLIILILKSKDSFYLFSPRAPPIFY